MLSTSVWLLVCVWGFASCSITCPDRKSCPDGTTCCLSFSGYSCCPFPQAVCCTDLAHCCPSGYTCNLLRDQCEKGGQPWLSVPMMKKEAAEEPRPAPALPASLPQEMADNRVEEPTKSTNVRCDAYYTCPDRTTCCRHPKGPWFCCPYYPGRCCLDGFHCCPYGYDCDLTYTHCVRDNLRYPFAPRIPLSSIPASPVSSPEDQIPVHETPMTALTKASDSSPEANSIRCDSRFYCPSGSTCCKGSTGQWTCCPYPLGQCCADGRHCCQYGYTCDFSSTMCRKSYSALPAGEQQPALTDNVL